MKKVTIHTPQKDSTILIGEKWQNFSHYLPGGKTIIITDENISRHYGHALKSHPVIEIGLGEGNKSLETLHQIFDHLLELEADRNTFILGIGGGIVCDVTGFAASIYMRGLPFGFISTTLLSQVDASTGGKNGVNFRGFKNIIGVFSQPEFVICDPGMLHTLDIKELRAGFAEVVKVAAIKDAGLFSFLEEQAEAALKLAPSVIEKLVSSAVAIKASVVEQDEREKGERRILNFGHTFAHTIENLTGMLHGEAVSIGMVIAARLSAQMGLLEHGDVDRIIRLLERFQLPVQTDLMPADMMNAMKRDKKRDGDSIHMVLLDRIGNAITRKIEYKQLNDMLHDLHHPD